MSLHLQTQSAQSSCTNTSCCPPKQPIRNTAKNKIQERVGGRKDYKIDCIAAEFKDWEISW